MRVHVIRFLFAGIAVLLSQGFQCAPGSQTASAIDRHFTIYEEPGAYLAWPSIVRARNKDLVVAFTRTEEHLGPDGQILMVRSTDNARSWEAPSVLFDTVVDDRESGFTIMRDGTLLAHFWSTWWTPAAYARVPGSYPDETLARWSAFVATPGYLEAESLHGSTMRWSSDNGNTWSEPLPGEDSIHGGTQLADGTILLAAYRKMAGSIGVYTLSGVDGTFERVARIDCPTPDSLRFGEPHVLQMSSGRVLMMIRATAKPYNDQDPRCVLWQSWSDDGGRSWAPPEPTPLWGFPPHLTQLTDGRVLVTYGHRRAPFGQRACLSEDGVTWRKEDEIVLRDDAANGDLGYPVSIELEPGRVLSVYYQVSPPTGRQDVHPPDPERKKPGILGTIWRVPPR